MKIFLIIIMAVSLTGCDPGYGFSRSAIVHQMPDRLLLQKDIESHSEIKKVEYTEEKPNGPWWDGFSGFSGYYLNYEGRDMYGTIWFEKDDKDKITYHQSMLTLGLPPTPEMVRSALPFMKKIEYDLETKFGLPEIEANLKLSFYGMKNPEEETPAVFSTSTKSE